MQTRGVWIIEIAELDSMSRSEVGKIKAFMSPRRTGVKKNRPKRRSRTAHQSPGCSTLCLSLFSAVSAICVNCANHSFCSRRSGSGSSV